MRIAPRPVRLLAPVAAARWLALAAAARGLALVAAARWLALAALVGGVAACDDTAVGQDVEDPAPPVLVKLLVQDPDSQTAVDLLAYNRGAAPEAACSDAQPCPIIGAFACVPSTPPDATDPTKGTCQDALNPAHTPAPIGHGSVQIRLVFSKLLAATTESVSDAGTFALADPTLVKLVGPDGSEVPATKDYDESGSPTATSDVFMAPYGPAIVLAPTAPLHVATKYQVVLDPSRITDRAGQAAMKDANGPIASSYAFTTEHFYVMPASGSEVTWPIALGTPRPRPMAPNEVVQIVTNALLDVSRLSVTVTDGSHAPVPIEFGLDQNILGHPCFALQWQVDVWRVSAPGMPIDWAPGTYTLAVSGLVDQADPMAPLELDPQGTAPFTGGTFTVQGPDKPQPDLEGALLHPPPESCPAPPPAPVPDMAAPPDAGAIPDGGENG